MPDDLSRMLRHFNGGETFVKGIYFVTLFGLSLPTDPPDFDWFIDRYTPAWRVQLNRPTDWVIAMTCYGGLIALGEDGLIREWDNGEGRWATEIYEFAEWLQKLMDEGIAFFNEVDSEDRCEPSAVPVMSSPDSSADVDGKNAQEIQARIADYSAFLQPLKEVVGRYVKHPSLLGEDGVMLVGHQPWVGPKAYVFRLYPPVEDDEFERFCRRFGIEVPPSYGNVLRELNGAFCFGMSLFGITRSMLGDPPLIDRTVQQCHDLAVAAKDWIRQYRVPAGLFHFGYRHFSDTENTGYFIERDKRILSVKNKGEVVGEWNSFTEFLADELKASEKLEEEMEPSQWAT